MVSPGKLSTSMVENSTSNCQFDGYPTHSVRDSVGPLSSCQSQATKGIYIISLYYDIYIWYNIYIYINLISLENTSCRASKSRHIETIDFHDGGYFNWKSSWIRQGEVRVWAIMNAMNAGLNRINPGGKINGTSIANKDDIWCSCHVETRGDQLTLKP